MNFKQYIYEASYSGNIGFTEMVKFYERATEKEEKEMDEILKKEDWDSFRRIIYQVTGVRLK
jgi:hypothetical protein